MTTPTQADRDAHRTATALGRLITITIGLALIAIGITTADGTALPAAAWITGVALICRVLHVAASKETRP